MGILCALLSAYMIAVFGRIILSWFPARDGTALAAVNSALFSITEPVLGPLRRMLPSVGGSSFRIDLSPMIVLIGIQIVRNQMGCNGLF